MSAPLLIIAAGGTGGHMFPAQALAEEMLARGWRVKLATDVRGAQYAGGFSKAVERQVVGAASPSQGGLGAKLKMPFRIIGGTISAMRAMRRDPPNCVVGFGGYPAFPAMAAAWLLQLPRLIHEQNGVLGRVNAVFAGRVDAVACGTWPTKLPAGVTGQHIGNPVRASVRAKAGSPYISPGDWPMELVVFGGSQGASVMSVVPKALALVAPKYRKGLSVTHQARDFDLRIMTEAYADLGIRAEIATFFDDIPNRMARAQLVICRAGASSVADLSVIGRPSILIPLAAAIRDEQSANAAGLVEAGAAIMVTEAELTPKVLAGHITAILRAPKKTAKMAAAALATGIPDAAERLADLVEATAKKEPAP